MKTLQEQLNADIAALTPEEEKETREAVISIYGNRDWTLEEIATQARYWRETKGLKSDEEDLEREYALDHPKEEEKIEAYVQMTHEKIRICFNDFIVELFQSPSGSIGITVENSKEESKDIFVDKYLNINVIEG